MAILSSCCCIPVESAATLVGLFTLLSSVVMFLGSLPSIAHYQPKERIFALTENGTLIDPIQIEMDKKDLVRKSFLVLMIIVMSTLISSTLLLFGIKHRNRFLMLPWMLWTGLSVLTCQVWIMITTTPVLMGDLFLIVLVIWSEMCVISHYQNLRDGIYEASELHLAAMSALTPGEEPSDILTPPVLLSVDLSAVDTAPPPYVLVVERQARPAQARAVSPPPTYEECCEKKT